MKTEDELGGIVSGAERDSGMEISLLRNEDGEEISVLLERYFAEEKPEAVLAGAFAALDLRPLAENFPDVRFYIFDAPAGRLPPQSPFVWVRFDARPAMPGLAGKIRAFLEGSGGAGQGGIPPEGHPRVSPALAFLDPAMEEYFTEDAVLGSLDIRRIGVPHGESDEALRGRITDALALKPALYIIAAGPRTAMVLDLVRQQGSPGGIVLDGGEDLPELAGFPVLASLERSYSLAIRAALESRAGPGEVVTASLEIR
jgi:hypothetical protein